jgi:hypothetical protein
MYAIMNCWYKCEIMTNICVWSTASENILIENRFELNHPVDDKLLLLLYYDDRSAIKTVAH